MKNPEVVNYERGKYIIRFVRRSWSALIWIQDLTGRKLKRTTIRPPVLFDSKENAEREIRDVVIPYLLSEKDIDPEEISGWTIEKKIG